MMTAQVCAISATWQIDNLPTEQLADVNSSDDDETETYDVDEALAATTSTSSSSLSVPSDDVAQPVTTVVMQLH